MLVALGDADGEASVLAFFFDELEEDPEELEVELPEADFFFAVEVELEAAVVPVFFVVEFVPVVVVFLVVLAAVVLVCVSLWEQEAINAAATVRARHGSKNFFIGVFQETVQTALNPQAYSAFG